MCQAPNLLPNGSFVGCRRCWQCRVRRIDEWAGRCIAESKKSKHSAYVTLTYGRDWLGNEDHTRAKVLTYSDVQKYFKRLGKAGYRPRYFCVGEYGSLKGRAHWHLLLFFKDKVPDDFKRPGKFINHKHWDHGHVDVDVVNYKSCRYVLKYLNKEEEDETKHAKFSMTKFPPLGHEWFMEYARQYVEQGLAPQDLKYRFPDVKHRNRTVHEFIMTRKTAENFLQEFVDRWREKHPHRHIPNSDLVEEYLDSLEPEDLRLQRKHYKRKRDVKEAQKEWDERKEFKKDAQEIRNRIDTKRRKATKLDRWHSDRRRLSKK